MLKVSLVKRACYSWAKSLCVYRWLVQPTLNSIAHVSGMPKNARVANA